MRILTTTLCYPRPDSPDLGVFVQRRALALASLGHDIRVVSPQPWCPILRKTRSDPDQMSPLHVRYPRMFSLPLLGRATDGLAYCRALRPAAADLIRQDGRGFDLIDAHFVYPDGVGALLAARRLRVPVVVTVRGKIVSLSRRLGRRAQIRAMLRRVDGIIAVSRSLARCVHDLAGDDLPVDVIPNGIDQAVFHPLDRQEARGSLNWDPRARYVLAIGHMQRLKGFDRLVEVWPTVMSACGDARLVLAGSERGEPAFAARLYRAIDRVNRTASRPCVTFLGPQPPDRLNLLYNAADVFANAARSEGWCNAINEALAAGAPVVAADIGGNAEQVCSPRLGLIVPEGDPDALAGGVIAALNRPWDRSFISAAGSRRTWQHVAREVEAVFHRVLADRRGARVSDLPAQTSAKSPADAQALEVPA